jgi:hypothetical protein
VRRPNAAILLRRGRTIPGVVLRRAAITGWHAAVAGLRHQDVDETNSFRRQLRGTLEDLGPAFVKLGQLLSTRSDLIPPRLQRELAMLRDHAPNISRAALVAELERSLGSASTESFATFDFVPVACAHTSSGKPPPAPAMTSAWTKVARLMRELAIQGVSRRRKKMFTTRADPNASRAPDLVGERHEHSNGAHPASATNEPRRRPERRCGAPGRSSSSTSTKMADLLLLLVGW